MKKLHPQVAGAVIANRAFRTLLGEPKQIGCEGLTAFTLLDLLMGRRTPPAEKAVFSFSRDGAGDCVSFGALD
jgi:hypothetical protein